MVNDVKDDVRENTIEDMTEDMTEDMIEDMRADENTEKNLTEFDDNCDICDDYSGRNILQCEDLCKAYGKKVALKGINLSLPAGGIVGLLGPNGAGKSTLIKLINGLLTPTSGTLTIDGHTPGRYTKSVVAYLPERTYFDESMRVRELMRFFADFYADFDSNRAAEMLRDLNIDENARLKTLSKGTREKVQLIMVMSRRARLYCLDEPIAGVDPAARDYILRTIINNYDPAATVLISTHLIADIEQVLDEVVFLRGGEVVLHKSVEDIRCESGKSVDALFREVFKC